MVLQFSGWHPKATAVTTTIVLPTVTPTASGAATGTNAVEKMTTYSVMIMDLALGPDGVFWTLVLLYAILSISTFIQSRRHLSEKREIKRAVEQNWDLPWLTKDWTTLYGLIAMVYEDESMYTPLRRKYIRSIQQRWNSPKRSQLRMLLEKGIVPLFIQDGGMSTEQISYWSWNTTFPFIKLSSFRQAKRRACFEFLLPHPERKHARQFLEILGHNKWRYGVQVRTCNQVHGREIVRTWEEPAAPYEIARFPLSVGAEAVMESILPILPDKSLDTARSDIVDGLEWYLKDMDTENIPLMHYTDVCIFRVEAGHWGPAELDSFVLGCAEKSGIQYRWPVDVTRRKAIRELGCHRLTA